MLYSQKMLNLSYMNLGSLKLNFNFLNFNMKIVTCFAKLL